MADMSGRKRTMVRDDQAPNKSLFEDTKKSINMLLNEMEAISEAIKQTTTNPNFKIVDVVYQLSELFNLKEQIRVNIKIYLDQIRNERQRNEESQYIYKREYEVSKTQIERFIKMPKRIIDQLFSDLSGVLETINDRFNIAISIMIEEFINNNINKVNTGKRYIDSEIDESKLTYFDITNDVKKLVAVSNELLNRWNNMNVNEQKVNANDYIFQLKQSQRSLVVIYLPKLEDRLREVYNFLSVYTYVNENKKDFEVPFADKIEEITETISNTITYAEKVNESISNNIDQIEKFLNN